MTLRLPLTKGLVHHTNPALVTGMQSSRSKPGLLPRDQVQTSLKLIPGIITGSVSPIIWQFFSSFPQKVADGVFQENPDISVDVANELIEEAIVDTFKAWYHNDDFFARRTSEIEKKFPDLMRLWEDYTRAYFHIIPAARNYDVAVIEKCDLKLSRPSLLMFVKTVYQLLLRALLRDLVILEDDDELDDLITSKVKIAINKLICMENLMETQKRMDAAQSEWLQEQERMQQEEPTAEAEADPKTERRRKKRRRRVEEVTAEQAPSPTLSKRDVPMDVALYTLAEMEKQKELEAQQAEAEHSADPPVAAAPVERPTKRIVIQGDYPSAAQPPADAPVEPEAEDTLEEESVEAAPQARSTWVDDFE